MRLAHVLAGVLVANAFAGCSNAESSKPTAVTETQLAQASDAKPAPAAAAPAPAAAAAPAAPAPAKPVMIGKLPTRTVKDVLVNGNFETWDADKLKGWNCEMGKGSTWEKIVPDKTKEPIQGDVTLSLPKPADAETMVILKQELPKGEFQVGQRLRVKALAKARTGEQLQIVLGYREAGKGKSIYLTHPGGSDWRRLEHVFIIPKEADPNSFAVYIYRRTDAEGEVFVDDLAVTAEAVS